MFKTIVVGTDGSNTAEKAIEEASELASAVGASVHIVRAVAGPGGDPEGELERAAETVKNAGVEAETHIVRDDASEALIAAAEEHNADLILIGNKGMAGARRFLLGSVPNDVAHHAPCSVLIARTS
ncbi:MAG: universal stress protein [Thermoleophilaceae bacterium]|jgi:nucleotide-binding universal stress UspA family protein